jgi:protein-S-isoprenylcysteine O-methyltransferase Ste14
MLRNQMFVNLLKSISHNIGVVIVGFIFAFISTRIDLFLGIKSFESLLTVVLGSLLLTIGFLLRLWATFYFYQLKMGVIKLAPQNKLITSGPFRYSRNPLYLGGNVFIFLGVVLFLGSSVGLLLTAINIVLVDFMIKREERQLEKSFGEEWLSYKKKVRRWL